MYDIIIIGGGAVGCTIGRCLSKYNLHIGLLEKNIEVCQETTKSNSAIVHGGYDTVPGTLKARLNVMGNSMFPQLSQELDFTFRNTGSLVLAFSDEEMETIEELYNRGIENGVVGLEIVDGNRAREIEPKVSESVIGALYCGSAGVVDPFDYTYAMVENAIENGVELHTSTKVVGISQLEDHLVVKTDKGDFASRYVINAAGLYSDVVARMAGDDDFKIIPTKGVYRLLDKTKDDYLGTVLFQTPSKAGKGVLVTPTYDGNSMIGPTANEVENVEDTTTDGDSLAFLDSLGRKSVPGLDLRKTIRVFTGVRAKPDTGDFMIYPSNNLKGLIHCGGIESPGLASAPAIGKYVEDMLISMGMSRELNDDYNPYRKAIVRLAEVDLKTKMELISKDSNYGKIICRCESVSESEIIQAINRPGGARTVDGVKRRVRAGMGRCQGGFCGPRVLEILARELDVDPIEIQKDIEGSEIVVDHLKG